MAFFIMTAIGADAQSNLAATLSHEGNVSTFYGGTAFKEAYEVAQDGDIITLSAGSFPGLDIKKNLTIRGAGMELNGDATVLTGNLGLGANELNSVNLEGIIFPNNIYFKLNNCSIAKCRFIGKINDSNGIKNVNFIHCIISEVNLSQSKHTASFISCVFNKFKSRDPSSVYNLDNCILEDVSAYSSDGLCLINCTLKNCYIKSSQTGPGPKSKYGTLSTNCVYATPTGEQTFDIGQKNCYNATVDEEPFADTEYHLKAEYASKWLGNDGTEVGIYGGAIPFDPATSLPKITKFNVASKTTADGKLSVDIEVKAN